MQQVMPLLLTLTLTCSCPVTQSIPGVRVDMEARADGTTLCTVNALITVNASVNAIINGNMRVHVMHMGHHTSFYCVLLTWALSPLLLASGAPAVPDEESREGPAVF